MKNNHLLAWAVLAVAGAPPVGACDLCSVYSEQEAQGGGTGFFAGAAEQYTDFGTFKSDDQSAPNPDSEYIHSFSSQLFAGYNFNQWAGVQFNLPIIYREYGLVAAHRRELGLGDASLVANFRLYHLSAEDTTFTWSDNFSAHIGADLPVSYNNSGDQILPSYRIHAAVTWHF